MIQTVYFGTYTRRESQGIYQADFNTETGELSNLSLISEETNPTYLAFAQDGSLYSVASVNYQGGVASFAADLSPLNYVLDDGASVCYVAVDEERNLVYGANYHKGQVVSYRRLEDGSLELATVVQHQGSGPHENQGSAHVHTSILSPDKYLVTCDLGTDEIITYDIAEDDSLSRVSSYHTAPGAGPRHLVFHNYYKTAYVINELNSTIDVLIYDGVGEFEHLQTISTLPEGYDAFNGAAAIRISSDGKFLYGSNRGHNSIAVYRILADGSLELIEIVPTHGEIPRDFNFSPDEKFIIAVHQDSDNATVFQRDKETGKLTEISHDFYVPEAVCVTFK